LSSRGAINFSRRTLLHGDSNVWIPSTWQSHSTSAAFQEHCRNTVGTWQEQRASVRELASEMHSW
jgi:hypothetical protein